MAIGSGGLAQLGERGVRNAEVEGSNPLPSTITTSRRRSRRAPWLILITLLGAACTTTSSSVYPSASVTTLMWGWERHFSLDWTVGNEKGGGRLISGYVQSHHGEFALNVRLLAQALDQSGTVVGQRIEWVPGGITGFSRAYFEVPHLPPADTYRVSVWEYTWLQSDGDRR